MPKIFISIILLGLTLFLGVVFLWPQYQQLHNFQLQVKHTETEIQYQEEYYEDLSSISQKLEEYSEGITKTDSALPSNPRLLSLLKFLQDTTSENGLILGNINPFSISPSSGKDNIQEIKSSLSLTGSYSALKNFLAALRKSARLIEVENISVLSLPSLPISGETEIGVSDVLSFKLTIKTNSY